MLEEICPNRSPVGPQASEWGPNPRLSVLMMNLENKPVFSEQEWEQVAESLCLSPREVQITCGVFHDLKEAAIASRLGISPHTVHTYLERIYRKLSVNSRVQMVVRVVTEHLFLKSQQPITTMDDDWSDDPDPPARASVTEQPGRGERRLSESVTN